MVSTTPPPPRRKGTVGSGQIARVTRSVREYRAEVASVASVLRELADEYDRPVRAVAEDLIDALGEEVTDFAGNEEENYVARICHECGAGETDACISPGNPSQCQIVRNEVEEYKRG